MIFLRRAATHRQILCAAHSLRVTLCAVSCAEKQRFINKANSNSRLHCIFYLHVASIYGVPRGVPPVCAGMTVGRGPVGSRPKRAKKPPASRLSTSGRPQPRPPQRRRSGWRPAPRGRPPATSPTRSAPWSSRLGAPLLGDLVDGDLSRVGPSKAAQWPPGGHGPPRGSRAAARTHPRCAALTRRGENTAPNTRFSTCFFIVGTVDDHTVSKTQNAPHTL